MCLRDKQVASPDTFPKSMTWRYKSTTGTSNLRGHIKKHHLDLYVELCRANNIDPHEGIVGKGLSAPVPVAVTGPALEPFSKKALLGYIRNFVIANDQVRFSVFFNHIPHIAHDVSGHLCCRMS